MALNKDYKPGINDNISTADPTKKDPKYYTKTGEQRKNNAGRKQLTDGAKKHPYNIAMTKEEHDRALELQKEFNFPSLSALLVYMVDKMYEQGNNR